MLRKRVGRTCCTEEEERPTGNLVTSQLLLCSTLLRFSFTYSFLLHSPSISSSSPLISSFFLYFNLYILNSLLFDYLLNHSSIVLFLPRRVHSPPLPSPLLLPSTTLHLIVPLTVLFFKSTHVLPCFLLSNLFCPTSHNLPSPHHTTHHTIIYPSSCTLILSGRMQVTAGPESYKAEQGPMTFMGGDALTQADGESPSAYMGG